MSLIDNKRATFDYSIIETMEAGLVLQGFEVKSLRDGRGSLKGARVVARGGEAYLVGATIPAWQPANAPKSYDPERTRKLLLNKKQIAQVLSAEGEKGLTIIPLSVYNKGRNLKLSIGIARGKKAHDKRESIKKRDTERDIRRSLKSK
ncbi:MAG TPA: SsrA-binding protein SmpB [Candidatus Paceibacterota bacterium]|nr:SsrA-binding protein SmpB [Candidatus Paceibacterota bacterium]